MINKLNDYFCLFLNLTKRHLLVFFRNKIRMFFTLMVPFIILIVYILFLRNLELNTISTVLATLSEEKGDPAIKALASDPEFMSRVKTLVDSWMLSGIIAISTITVSLQTNTMIVADRESGVNKDFASSPISRSLLIGSYFLFNIIVTVLICFVFIFVCFIYLACLNEFCLTFVDFLTILGVLVFSSCVSVLFTVLISSFVKRDATMASITTIISTAIGFLIGAYMPLGLLTELGWVQNVCVFIPGTFSCSLMRFAFMSTPLNDVTAYVMEHVTEGEALMRELTNSFGYNVQFFGITLEPWMQAVGQLIFIVVLTGLNVLAGNNLIKVRGAMVKKLKKK